MFHNKNLGKVLLVLTVGLVPALAPLSARAAPKTGEEAWRQLVQGDLVGAGETARASAGLLDEWVRTVAEVKLGEQVTGVTALAAAAVSFEQRNFSAAALNLETLAAGTLTAGLPPVDRVQIDLRLAASYIEIGRIGDADSLLTVAIDKARTEGLPMSECYGLWNRGRTRLRMRQIEEPEEDLQRALNLAAELDLPRWSGTVCIALSVVSRLQMDLDTALTWREKALEHFRRADDQAGQARALHYIGVIRFMQGDLSVAITYFQDGLAMARQAENASVEGAVLGDLANANYLLGDFDGALEQFREAIRLVDNPWRQGMMLTNIGSIHEYRQDYEKAREILTEALVLIRQAEDKRTEATVLTSLGETLCELQEFTEGLAYLDQAVDLAREFEIPMTEAFALKCRGHGLLDSGDLAGAQATLAEATEVARRIGYFEIIEWSLLGQAMVARREGRLEDALAHLQEALDEVDQVRRRSGGSSAVASDVTSQAVGIFAETIDVLFHLHSEDPGRGLDGQAFAVAQEAKARSFLDLLVEAEFDLNVSSVPGYRQMEGEILTRIIELENQLHAAAASDAEPDSLGSLRARLAAAEDELHLLEARLRADDPRYAEVLYPEPLTLTGLGQEVLKPGEVFLEYALGDSASYVWAVDRRGARMVALPARKEIEAVVREVLPLLGDYNLTGGDPAWLTPGLRKLYRILLEPVAEITEPATRLVISPDGILHYLPFEVLLTADDPVTGWQNAPFLGSSKIVTAAPSASVLARIRRRAPTTSDAGWLLVGDPLLVDARRAGAFARAAGARDLPPLPHVAEELETLGGLAPGGRFRTHAGAEATLANLLESGAARPHTLVHFATHGLFNEDRPRYSGLVLSPDPDQGHEGFLNVSEVFGLDLKCDQVVLSACASALGRNVSGEGLVGLTRGFMFAGARSVVAALWDVSGEATSLLMADLYQRLAADGSDRAASLAAAKRAMISGELGRLESGADPAHPAFWAAFVLSGDGQ